jgi:hypothetical protein
LIANLILLSRNWQCAKAAVALDGVSLSDADAQRPLPLSIIQILAVDLGTDMLPGPPARQAKYGKGWAIYAFPRGCGWPNVY